MPTSSPASCATWSDVGGATAHQCVLSRDDKSGTFDTFKHMVLGSRRRSAADAKRFESSEALSDAVAEDAVAIGFIGLPYVRSAKAVLVQDGKSVPLLASPMTVATEDYPLARRLYLYVPLAAPPAARELVDFALSDEGQRAVQAAGFVDLQPRVRPERSAVHLLLARVPGSGARGCRLSVDFRFDAGGEQLDTRALSDLQRIVTLMGRPEGAAKPVVLLGFSDGKGARADNVALSQERATSSPRSSARAGSTSTWCGLRPRDARRRRHDRGGRQRNRRVEVWLR